MAAKDIEDEKRQMFQKFLDTTNRKDGIHRDIMIESDDDPLASLAPGHGKIWHGKDQPR
jgi:hypothetical protein